jgi:hypothetical protein
MEFQVEVALMSKSTLCVFWSNGVFRTISHEIVRRRMQGCLVGYADGSHEGLFAAKSI